MGTPYETDIVTWATEQAALLRSGQLSAIDIENVAEEIEAMGRSERRELSSRMKVLLAHLLKWKYQPGRRSESWSNTIREQRDMLNLLIEDSPSLKSTLNDQERMVKIWNMATASAAGETGLSIEIFPETCPWTTTDILTDGWLPV
jgi:Domain of unknown function DUF29